MDPMPSPSPRFTLTGHDFKKLGIGAAVAIAGALLTYLTDVIPGVDLGPYTPVVVTVWSVIANAVRKFLTEYTP